MIEIKKLDATIAGKPFSVEYFIDKFLNDEYHALRVNDLESNDELLYIDGCYLELGDITLKEVESMIVVEIEQTNRFYGLSDSIMKNGYNVTVKRGK
ncbi:MAG TPA: hypothetical protein VLZ83_16510 [Edaphocola sp.]|nr:hypothetical protein [Edaphocola sp.]